MIRQEFHNWCRNSQGRAVWLICAGLVLPIVLFAPAVAQISDDFSAAQLDTSLWHLSDPRGDSGFALRRGILSLNLPAGTSHSASDNNNTTLRLLQTLPDTNIALEVRFESNPRLLGQQQGLMLLQSASTYLRFYLHHTEQNLQLRWAYAINHQTVDSGQMDVAASDTMSLRLTRTGSQWTCDYATSQGIWLTAFNATAALRLRQGGVYAANLRPGNADSPYDLRNPPLNKTAPGGLAPAYAAQIDYFFDTSSPIIPEDGAVSTAARTFTGLEAFYFFRPGSPGVAFDYANTGVPYHLTQLDTTVVSQLPGHGVRLDAPTLLTAPQPATALNNNLSVAGEITLEAWLTPATTNQAGPARILTLSADPANRNVTLSQGQWGSLPSDVFDVRLRTTTNSLNGQPDLVSPAGSLSGARQHVLYTRDASGTARLYIDGIEAVAGTALGDLSSWDPTYRLAIGGEMDNSRHWLGEIYLAAIYNRALSPLEVAANFAAGPDGGIWPPLPPAVILRDVAPGAMYTFADTIPMSAVANDADGTIAAVEFRLGTTVLFRDEIPPYHFEWVGPAVGGHQITAVAIDNDGLETSSDIAPIHVGVPDTYAHNLFQSDAFADSTFGAPWRITDSTTGTAAHQGSGSLYLNLPAANQNLWDPAATWFHADQNEVDANLALELMIDADMWSGVGFTGLEVADSLGATVRFTAVRHDGVWTLNWGSAATGAPNLTGARSLGFRSGPIWLQLRREGNTCHLFHSDDGLVWAFDATIDEPLTLNRAGWLAGALAGPATVVLDHAFNLVSPIIPEDGVIGDSTGPVISALAVTPDFNEIRLSWNTNELAYSRIGYGLTPALELGTVEGGSFATAHQLTLPALSPGQIYFFNIRCLDLAGNVTDDGPSTAATDMNAVTATGPAQGDIYRESALGFGVGNDDWRVTDPNALNPGAAAFLPNPTLTLGVPDLTGAIRAELIIDRWGGHTGTTGKRIRLNGGSWLHLSDPVTITDPQSECYVYADNPLIEIPLAQLAAGAVTLEALSSGQTCYNFDWGQWGWYGVILRVYYDNTVIAPTGSFLFPARGDTITDIGAISLAADTTGTINLIQILARYEGFDADGDGIRTGWHRNYRRARYNQTMYTNGIVGAATSAPWDFSWDATWIPDQIAGAVGLQARIRGANGIWSVSEVDSLTLNHSGAVVKAYPLLSVPRSFWVRAGQAQTAYFNIPGADSIATATSAIMTIATWNGADQGKVAINGINVAAGFGRNHYFSQDSFAVPPANLIAGYNTLGISSNTIHHGMEVCWPGPLVTVRYTPTALLAGASSRAPGDVDGNGVLDAQDTRLILNHLVGASPLHGRAKRAADRDGNGTIDISDATLAPVPAATSARLQTTTNPDTPRRLTVEITNLAGKHGVEIFVSGAGLSQILQTTTPASANADPVAWFAANDTLKLAWVGTAESAAICHLDFGPGIGQLTISGTVDGLRLDPVTTSAPDIPSRFELVGNYPNPFNPATTIAFNLPQAAPTVLRVHDLRGRLVATIVDETLPAGRHQVIWNGRDDAGRPVASGTFFYRLATGGQVWTKKMLLLK